MKRFIDVHAGEVMAGQGEVVLKSDSNRACLVIAAYDSVKKIGGLAHSMFSAGLRNIKDTAVREEAAKAIDEMLKDMSVLGSSLDNIEVCAVTGENTCRKDCDSLYCSQVAATMELLKERHIRMKNNSAGDAGDLHVSLDVESGKITYV